jgi:hypothetical protein
MTSMQARWGLETARQARGGEKRYPCGYRAPLASRCRTCLGACQERALDTLRDRLLGRGRGVLGVHALPRASYVDRLGLGDLASTQPPLGNLGVAHLFHAGLCCRHVLRSRNRPSLAAGRLDAAFPAQCGRSWQRAHGRLAHRNGRRRRYSRHGDWLGGVPGRTRVPNQRAIAARTSSTAFGIPAVSTSGPESLTRTSSSIRTPMPRHASPTVPSLVAM